MPGHVRKLDGRRKPWQVTYHDPAGRRRARAFVRKLDADRFLAEQTVEVGTGKWIDPRAGRLPFGEYARTWIDQRPVRESTRERYRGYWSHMRELHAVPLANLTPALMRAWQAALAGRLAASTAGTVRNVAATILHDAVRDKLVAASPLDDVAPPAKPDRVLVRPMPVGDAFTLAEAFTPRYRAAVLLGLGAGPRRGEAFGLTVDRVDFLRRAVTIDRQLVGVEAGQPVFGPPKTRASSRVVPVPGEVVEILAAHLAAWPAVPGSGWWREAGGALTPLTHGGLVFTAPRGGPAGRAKVGDAWRRAEGKAFGERRGGRFHDLRHVYASALIEAGESVKVVQARLGHASAQETLDTYAHLWPDSEHQTRKAIGAMFTRTSDEEVAQ